MIQRIKTGAYYSGIKADDVDMLMLQNSIKLSLQEMCVNELKKHLNIESLENSGYNIIDVDLIKGQSHDDFLKNEWSISMTVYFESTH